MLQCLVSWLVSRCFPATVSIICCSDTKGYSLLNTAIKLCTSVAEVTLRQNGDEGNYCKTNTFNLHISELLQTSSRGEDIQEANHLQKYKSHCLVSNTQNLN